MLTHKQFIDKWEWKRYRENPKWNFECVALIKLYCEKVYWIKGLSFGGSAINGWNKKGNLDTFFDRVDMPQQWDVVFFHATPSNKYWHVAIHSDYDTILEQNWWNWNGNWLWTNAIRLAKAPANSAGFMRPKPKPMTQIITQWSHPDCSLASVLNCYILNSWVNANKINQTVANGYFEEYISKHPKDAFYFLKDKGYNIKYIPKSIAEARIALKKGRALICRRKYMYRWWHDLEDDWNVNETQEIQVDNTRGHFFCLKEINWVVWAYDSNYPKPYKCEWERFVKAWVISKTLYQIR